MTPAEQHQFGAFNMSWGQSQERAANWAISLATNPMRPTTAPGVGSISATSFASTDMISRNLCAAGLEEDYVEWYGSLLHEQFLQCLKLHQGKLGDGDTGMAISHAMEEQLEATHLELRTLLNDFANGRSPQQKDLTCSPQAWIQQLQKNLVGKVVDELQLPEKYRHASSRKVEAVFEHALELLGYRDSTLRIIGGLVERELIILQGMQGMPMDQRQADDPIVLHVAQISQALNLVISSWCRRFGHLAQLTCGQIAGTNTQPGSHEMFAKRPFVFLWCGQDALQSLKLLSRQDSCMPSLQDSSTSLNAQAQGGWPAAVSSSVSGMSPFYSPETSLMEARLPGFRTEERAARSDTRALRALLRGGQGAAGQYVQGKYAAPKARPATSPSSSMHV